MDWGQPVKIYPKECFDIDSRLPMEDAIARIDAYLETRRWYLGSSGKRFSGQRDGNRFKIYRSIHYHNRFLPVIEGQIRPKPSGSRIQITIRPHWSTTAISLSFFGCLFVCALLGSWLGDKDSALGLLVVAVGWLLIDRLKTRSLAREISKLKTELLRLFRGVERRLDS